MSGLPRHGMLLVFAVVLAEQAGLPLPSFTVLIAAGAMAASGQVSLAAALAAAVVAALLANLAWYGAGLRYGQRVLRLLCRVSLSPDTCVRSTQSIFLRWGVASLLVSKFLPGVSLVAPPIAGLVRMPFRQFFAACLAGTVLWALVHLLIGYAFHQQLAAMYAYAQAHVPQALWSAAVLLGLYLAYRGLQRWFAAGGAGITRIEVEELRRLLDGEPPPVVLDLRSALLRANGDGIPNALAAELESIADAVAHVQMDRLIVTYCACPNDVSAVRAARALRRLGYARVHALRGGIDAWSAALAALERSA